MAIIIKRNEERISKVAVKELSYNVQLTRTGNNKQVEMFEIINDNLPNCRAHEKALTPEEMYAIYEYMKKVVEGA
jgi:hypothetical protein